MYLIEIFLPLTDNDGAPFEAEVFDRLREELLHQFGGVTIHSRSPAEGLWKPKGRSTSKDDILIFEIMADQLDRLWWTAFRQTQEAAFRQISILIRASETEIL